MLGKLPVQGHPTKIWILVGQGPTVLAVGAGGGVGTFFLLSITSLFFLPETARYRLKYCPKQPTNYIGHHQ